MTRNEARTVIVAVFTIAVIAIVGLVTLPKAMAVEQEHQNSLSAVYVLRLQPYGGCEEVLQDFPAYLNSSGADWCRAHGWTIRPRLVVGPHGVVRYSTLPRCRYEDGSGQRSACSWNFGRRQGNGRGLAYWVDRHDRTHYVWAHSPVGYGWNWVTHSIARRTHTSIRCVILVGPTTWIRCPNGRTLSS